MLLYIIVIFKPLVPFVSDALSHIFSEAIHIEKVHAIYGSNHLEKELSNSSSDNANNKSQKRINTEDQVNVHVSANECSHNFSFNRADNPFLLLKLLKLKASFVLKHFPPPKFS